MDGNELVVSAAWAEFLSTWSFALLQAGVLTMASKARVGVMHKWVRGGYDPRSQICWFPCLEQIDVLDWQFVV